MTMSSKDIIIVIPAYNPNDSLITLVKQLRELYSFIIVVDDGSNQSCAQVFERIEEETILLRHYTNLGKGRALKTAFNHVLGMIGSEHPISGVITVDADGQHSIEDVRRIHEALGRSNYKDLVLGCRSFEGKDKDIPLRSRLGNTITRKVFHLLCGIKISDIQTGLRGIPCELCELFCTIDGERYEYETNMILQTSQLDISISEVPIQTIYEDNNESSHFNPLLDSIKIYKVILSYAASSILAWAIDYVVFNVIIALGGGVLLSNYVARGLSAIVNYNVNRKAVFKAENSIRSLIGYIVLLFVSGTISAILIELLESISGIKIWILKVLVEIILFFFNYFIQNTLIFRRKASDK